MFNFTISSEQELPGSKDDFMLENMEGGAPAPGRPCSAQLVPEFLSWVLKGPELDSVAWSLRSSELPLWGASFQANPFPDIYLALSSTGDPQPPLPQTGSRRHRGCVVRVKG